MIVKKNIQTDMANLFLTLFIVTTVVSSFRTHHKHWKIESFFRPNNIEKETPTIQSARINNLAIGKRHNILGRMRREVSTTEKSHHASKVSTTEKRHHASEVSTKEKSQHGSEVRTTEKSQHGSEVSTTEKSHHGSEVSTTEKRHHGSEVSTTEKSQHGSEVSTTEYFQSYEDPVDHNFIEISTKKRVGVKWTEERKKKHIARMKAYWDKQRAQKERKKQEDKEFWEDQTRRDLADTNPLEYVYNYDRNDPKNINPAGRNYTGFKPYVEHYTYLPTNATGNNVWYVDY